MNNRPTARAFTLIELLVVVSILALLISILLPALGRARKNSQRTVCLSNERQCALACNMYANDYNDWLPQGNIHPDETQPEYWSETNFSSCLAIHEKYQIDQQHAICGDWEKKITEFFYEPPKTDNGFYLGGTSIGFIYYGRRYDQPDNPLSPITQSGKTYRSVNRITDSRTKATSPTLFSCYHWDTISSGGKWGAKMPHIQDRSASYLPPESGSLPKVEGLAIGMIDTSAHWTKWNDLHWFEQNKTVRMYYAPWN